MRITTIRAFALTTYRAHGMRHQRALDMEAEVESGDAYSDVSAELQRRVDAELATWIEALPKDGVSGAVETPLPTHLADRLFIITDTDQQPVKSIEQAVQASADHKAIVHANDDTIARIILREWNKKMWRLEDYHSPNGNFSYIGDELPF